MVAYLTDAIENHLKQYKAMELGTGKKTPSWYYEMVSDLNTKTQDLGVISKSNLSPEMHTAKITGETYGFKKICGIPLCTGMKM